MSRRSHRFPRQRATLLLVATMLVIPIALGAQNAAAGRRPTAAPVASFAEPGISPDGREIAFVSGSDIWAVPTGGGEARLLVSDPAAEARPLYSPDGTRLAFTSTRAGSVDIWMLTLGTGDVRRLTFDDGAEQLDGWSADGQWIYFTTAAHDIAGMTDIYRVRADGGTPMPVAADRYANEFMSAPAPDGSAVAIVARGFGLSQWWRKGRSHLDESELWLVRGDGSRGPAYERVMPAGAKQQWPMWSADGKSLFYISDRSGTANVWVKPASGEPKRLTSFDNGRVLWPSITHDGATIAFERDFGIWMLDTKTGATHQVPITLRGSPAATSVEHLVLTSGFQNLALSPDGKKIAVVARGDIFAASASDGGDAVRVTSTPAIESQVRWAPDSRRIVYTSNRDGAWHVYSYDFSARAETQLTAGGKSDISPIVSPDGRSVAFLRDGREVHVLAFEDKQDRVVATGIFSRPPFVPERPLAWSPDNKWVAYLSGGTKLFMNAYVVPAAGGEAHQVSWLANTRANSISWSADGSYLLLDTGMRTEPGMLARVDLLPHTPRFREAQFATLFRDEPPGRTTPVPTPPQTTPARPAADSAAPATERVPDPHTVRIVFDGIHERTTIVPIGVDVGVETVSPDGKEVVVTADVAGQQNLFLWSLDELAADPKVARQLTTTPGNKNSVQFSPDGKTVYFLEQGRVASVAIETRTAKTVALRAELDADFAREKGEVFNQAWEYLNDNFYDPAFHGVDWNGVHTAYAPRIAGARTTDEMRRILSLMIGEMNASHMGISGPGGGTGQRGTGRIGLHFDRAAYEQRGELRVSEIIPLGPAALSGRVNVGDVLLAVDGASMGKGVSLDSALAYKFDRPVVLTIASNAAGAGKRDVTVRAVNGNIEKGLLYRAWVAERRAMVAALSGGKLGYVHMLDMGANALAQLNLDLDAEDHAKAGVVVDVRNNNGGFMNGHALDVLFRPDYVTMTRRGVSTVPGRPVLGQRALEAPTILITNQHTLSDGENFTEGYRTMHLGKVVGEPTAGWDVYTGAGTMVDGTSVRLPFMKNGALDGSALERAPRAVDIRVDRAMGESYAKRDSQLEAAVKALSAQIASDARRAGGRER